MGMNNLGFNCKSLKSSWCYEFLNEGTFLVFAENDHCIEGSPVPRYFY